MSSCILAVDPGYDRCGVAVIKDDTLVYSTCIVTNKKDQQENRLYQIYREISVLIGQWQPTHIAIETIFFSNNKTTAIKVAEARGVFVLLAGMYRLALVDLSPQDVKLAVTGVGNADKKQVQKMVALTLKLRLDKKLDDEVDAIAVGIAASGVLRLKTLAKKKSI